MQEVQEMQSQPWYVLIPILQQDSSRRTAANEQEKEIRNVTGEKYGQEVKRIYKEIKDNALKILPQDAPQLKSIMRFLEKMENTYHYSEISQVNQQAQETIYYLQKIANLIKEADSEQKLKNLLKVDFNPLFQCEASVITRLSDIARELEGVYGLPGILYQSKEDVVRFFVVGHIFQPQGGIFSDYENNRKQIASWFLCNPGMEIHNIDSIMAIAGSKPDELQLLPKDVSQDIYAHQLGKPFLNVSAGVAERAIIDYLKYCLKQEITQKKFIEQVVMHIEGVLPSIESWNIQPDGYMMCTEHLRLLFQDEAISKNLRNALLELDDNAAVKAYSPYQNEIITFYVEDLLRKRIGLEVKRAVQYKDFTLYTLDNKRFCINLEGKFHDDVLFNVDSLKAYNIPMQYTSYMSQLLSSGNAVYQDFVTKLREETKFDENYKSVIAWLQKNMTPREIEASILGDKSADPLRMVVLHKLVRLKNLLSPQEKCAAKYLEILANLDAQQQINNMFPINESDHIASQASNAYCIWSLYGIYASNPEMFQALTSERAKILCSMQFNPYLAILERVISGKIPLEKVQLLLLPETIAIVNQEKYAPYRVLMEKVAQIEVAKLSVLIRYANPVMSYAPYGYIQLIAEVNQLPLEKIEFLLRDPNVQNFAKEKPGDRMDLLSSGYSYLVKAAAKFSVPQLQALTSNYALSMSFTQYDDFLKVPYPCFAKLSNNLTSVINTFATDIKQDKPNTMRNLISQSMELFLSKNPVIDSSATLTEFVDGILKYASSYAEHFVPERTAQYQYTQSDVVRCFCDAITQDIKDKKFTGDYGYYKKIAQEGHAALPQTVELYLQVVFSNICRAPNIRQMMGNSQQQQRTM